MATEDGNIDADEDNVDNEQIESRNERRDGDKSSRVHSFTLWFTLSVAFSLCFVRRFTIPTWSDALANDFRADAAEFGTLSGGYWYAYAALQIPSGTMLDLCNRHAVASHVFLLFLLPLLPLVAILVRCG